MKTSNIKQIFILFVSISLVSTISSCSGKYYSNNYNTNTIDIQVLKPATIDIPEGVSLFGIVHVEKSKGNKPLEITKSEKESLHDNTRKSCINGLYKHINESEGLNKAIVLTSNISLVTDSINWDEISTVCRKNNVDALIYLTRLKINNSLLPGRYNYDSYGRLADLEIKTTWIVLFPGIKKRIEKDVQYNKLAHIDNDKDQFIYDAGESCGIKFGKDIIPGWTSTKRKYFITSNSEFKQASQYVQESNWNDAAIIWESFLSSENKSLAGKAHYNLALHYELQGNLDKAFELAKKSDQGFKTPLSHEYAGILYKRINDQYKLAQQIQQ